MWQLSVSPEWAQGVALADCQLRWWHAQGAGQGNWQAWQAAVAECAEAALALRLILPVEAATVLHVELPTRKQRWLQQALAYAVEEQLAEDIDNLHLAIGEANSAGLTRVVAVRKNLLQATLTVLQGLPFKVAVQSIQLDAEQFPLPDAATAAWCVSHGRAVWRNAQGEVIALTASMLRQQLAVQAAPGFRFTGEAPSDWPEAIELSANQPQADAIELAQGPFTPQSTVQPARRWLPVAALAALWAVLQWGFNLGQGVYLQQQADSLAAQSTAQYQQLFPEDRRIVNLEAQFREHLRQGEGSTSSGFLAQLQQVGAGLLQQGSGVRVVQLDYRRSTDSLSFEVEASDFAALEALRRQFTEQGLPVQVGSASREGDRVVARVSIGGEA